MTILHYEFLEKIGSGGMGEVFRAHDKRLNRDVAIKALPYAAATDPDRRRRFVQEAQTASALNHPNIITILDVFHEGETHFIVMEYVPGRTLLQAIPPTGMRVSQMLLCSAQMAAALSAAHEADIVHRDFKPANVMITHSGLVKVVDFGLAKLLQPQSAFTANAAAASDQSATVLLGNAQTRSGPPQTAEGSILGTANYMAPEQAEGKKVDARADIFALGTVMYEMLTGRRAFQGDSDIATLSAVLRDEPKPIAEIMPGVPPELEDLIRGCLRKDPDARWQTMKEVELKLMALKRRADAGEFSGQHAVVAPVATAATAAPAAPVAPAAQRQPTIFTRLFSDRKTILILAGVGAVLLVAGSAAIWMVRSRSHVPPPAQVSSITAQLSQPAPPPVPAPEPQPAPESATPTPPAPVALPAAPAAPKKTVPPTPPPQAVAHPDAASAAPAAPVAPLAPVPAPEPPKPARTEAPIVSGPPVTVSVGDGIAFAIALAEDVRNDADQGTELTFRSSENVKVGDVLVIARGATVKGSVVNASGKRFLGVGGKMTFQLLTVETVDGQKIPIRASVTRRADGPTTRPVDTGRYAKSKELAAARGTDYIAYIDGDHTVTLRQQQTPASQ